LPPPLSFFSSGFREEVMYPRQVKLQGMVARSNIYSVGFVVVVVFSVILLLLYAVAAAAATTFAT
jgi:hypothetical protein